MTDEPFKYVASTIVYNLIFQRLMNPRPGLLGWIARKFNWSYGWMELEKSEADALLELGRQLRIYE